MENNFFNLFIQDAFHASLSDVALMVSASAIAATDTLISALGKLEKALDNKVNNTGMETISGTKGTI